ncbi:protein kinase [Streptomyces sp. NPDC049837]|uniref:serine/threonine-protein kinase n=1 Tax=Streptomyces sp. NPDC049837 TaxID=3155277 RepID=UPI0034157593
MSGSGQQRRIVGRYRLDARLGRGGMGTVWRAYDELLGRRVAVKELHVDVGTAVYPTLREARAIARVHHPHIVCVHDVVEEDGVPYIVMELVEGLSLAERIAAQGPLDAREAARIGLALLSALRAAHALGVLHRDLKPANVLLEEGTGRVVLTDFGIAQLAGSTTITEAGMFVGSPEYTAPERMQGAQAGPETDLWSLGALLCATLTGQSPFHRDSLGGVLHAVVEEDFRPPAAAGPLLPVVRGLLQRDPARRMGAAEAERLLRAYAEAGRPRGYEGRGYEGRAQEAAPVSYTGRATGAAGPYADTVPPREDAARSVPSDAVPDRSRRHGRARGRAQRGQAAGQAPAPTDARADAPADRVPPRGDAVDAVGAVAAVPPRGDRPARRRLRTPLVAAVLLVALAGAGAAGVLLLRGDGLGGGGGGGGDHPTATVSPSRDTPTAPNTPGAAAGTGTSPGTGTGAGSGPGPAPTHARVPTGYRSVSDPRGFSLTVPKGYVRSTDGRRVYYMSPDKAFRIGIRTQSPEADGPLGIMRRAHANGPETYVGYRAAKVTPTTHNGLPAALWEFTWNGFSGSEGARRTFDLCWDEGGRTYDVWVSAPPARLDELKRHFDTVLDSFRVSHS